MRHDLMEKNTQAQLTLDTKFCKQCGEHKLIHEFHRNRAAEDGRYFMCKPCHKVYSRERRKNQTPLQRAKWNNRARYGIEPEEIEAMHKAQDDICPACCTPLRGKYVTDHCHKTKKVRALLHAQCNAALGMMREDFVSIQQLSSYARWVEGVACGAVEAPLMRVQP
jgi:hypothetical protein